MLIRSQDNTILANLEQYKYLKIRAYERKIDNKGKIIYVYDGGYGTPDFNCWKIGTSDFDLGEYSTEEKAIKVLDMIQDAYVGSLWTDSHYDITAQANVSDVIANNIVFRMPLDSEVEV